MAMQDHEPDQGEYDVTVVRTAVQVITVRVKAASADAASEKAITQTPSLDFTGETQDYDFHVGSVVRIDG